MLPRPSIVVPGIKGTSLENYYAVDPAQIWSTLGALETEVFGPDFTSLALDPSARTDLASDILVRPYQALSAAYAPLVSALRGHTIGGQSPPAYLFPYDWRFSVAHAAQRLLDFVDAAVVKGQRIGMAGWDGKLNFVCHSMGGLVFRAFLRAWRMRDPAAPLPVGRVVFLAVPHLGSLEAVEMLIRGESLLLGRKEMRKLARTFPSVYELLPRFAGAVLDAAGAAVDIWQEAMWQTNVTTATPDPNGLDVVQARLDDAARVLGGLPFPVEVGVAREDVLTIHGRRAGKTLLNVSVGPNAEENVPNWFDFDHATFGDGDGIVPTTSSVVPGAGCAAIEIAEADVPYLDVKTRLVSMHAFLPTLDEVSTVVARFFDGANTAGELVPRGMPDGRYVALP